MTGERIKLPLYGSTGYFFYTSLDEIVGFEDRPGYVELKMVGGHKVNVAMSGKDLGRLLDHVPEASRGASGG